MKDKICLGIFLFLAGSRPLVSSMTYPWSDWVYGAGTGLLFLLALDSSSGRRRELKSWWFLACGLFVLSTAIAFLRSSCSWEWGLAGLFQGIQIALGVVLGRWLLKGSLGFRRYSQALLLCTLYLAVDAYGELHGGLDEMEEYVRLYRPDLLANEELVIRLQNRAAFSTFFYPNALAGFAGLALCLGAARIVVSSGGRSLFLPTAGFMASAYILFAAKSEGGFLAASFGIVCLSGLQMVRWEVGKRMKILLGAIVCLLLLLPMFLMTDWTDWFFLNLYKSARIRWGYWATAFRMIVHHPILGMGFGGYETYFTDYAPSWAAYVRNPHSLPLQLWMERGFLGILSFSYLYFTAVRGGVGRFRRLLREERIQEGMMWACGVAGVATCLFHALGEVDLSVSGIMMPLSVLLGILSAGEE